MKVKHTSVRKTSVYKIPHSTCNRKTRISNAYIYKRSLVESDFTCAKPIISQHAF